MCPKKGIKIHTVRHVHSRQYQVDISPTFTMNVKSVIAGEYTAPPAQGPMIKEI